MNKNCTDIKQSMKLMEILPLESADAYYIRKIADFMGNPVDGKWGDPKFGNPQQADYIIQNFTSYETIRAWSLAALLEYLREIDLFPDIIDSGDLVLMDTLYYNNEEGKVLHPMHFFRAEGKTILDAAFETILKLNELKML